MQFWTKSRAILEQTQSKLNAYSTPAVDIVFFWSARGLHIVCAPSDITYKLFVYCHGAVPW